MRWQMARSRVQISNVVAESRPVEICEGGQKEARTGTVTNCHQLLHMQCASPWLDGRAQAGGGLRGWCYQETPEWGAAPGGVRLALCATVRLKPSVLPSVEREHNRKP